MKSQFKIHLLIIFSAGILSFTGCSLLRQEFRGAVYGNPAPPPDFSIPSTRGENFSLSEETGKINLVFFGYTSCPDICPQTLGGLKAAINALQPEQREEIQVLFVTVDPERDTMQKVSDYLDRYDAGFIGAVPTQETLDSLKADYGVFAELEPPNEDGFYLVTHTGLVYVIDKQGNLRLGFVNGIRVEDIVNDLRILVRE